MSGTIYPEPSWGAPQEALGPTDNILPGTLSPFVLTGIFERLIQYHFSDPNNIINPQLKGYIWTPTPPCQTNAVPAGSGSSDSSAIGGDVPCSTEAASRLLITVSYERDVRNIQRRPSIYVQREDVVNQSFSQRNESIPVKMSVNALPGLVYQIIVAGAHSVICVGLTGAEADALSEEVYNRFVWYHPLIRDEFKLGYFWVAGISGLKELTVDAKKAWYGVVRLEWRYVLRWSLIQEAPVLKRIFSKMNA